MKEQRYEEREISSNGVTEWLYLCDNMVVSRNNADTSPVTKVFDCEKKEVLISHFNNQGKHLLISTSFDAVINSKKAQQILKKGKKASLLTK